MRAYIVRSSLASGCSIRGNPARSACDGTPASDHYRRLHPRGPSAGEPRLRALHAVFTRAILKRAAPKAEETIKRGNPFFVEPRFVYAFSAHKAHLSFAPPAAALQHFREELEAHDTTEHMLRVRYDEPLPEELIRRMAEYSDKVVSERGGRGFGRGVRYAFCG